MDVNGARKKTNASGVAAFTLEAGTYPVKVKKDGFSMVSDTVTVASAAVSKDVTLTSG